MKREESLIISKELEPLWYGYISDVDFTGTSHQTETIDLIKDTNKIRLFFKVIPIVISGLPPEIIGM